MAKEWILENTNIKERQEIKGLIKQFFKETYEVKTYSFVYLYQFYEQYYITLHTGLLFCY